MLAVAQTSSDAPCGSRLPATQLCLDHANRLANVATAETSPAERASGVLAEHRKERQGPGDVIAHSGDLAMCLGGGDVALTASERRCLRRISGCTKCVSPHVGARSCLLRCVCGSLRRRGGCIPCGSSGVPAAAANGVGYGKVAPTEGSCLVYCVSHPGVGRDSCLVDRKNLLRTVGRPQRDSHPVVNAESLRGDRHRIDDRPSVRIGRWCQQTIQEVVELTVSDGPLGGQIEPDRQGSGKPDGGERDIGRRDGAGGCGVAAGGVDEPFQHTLGGMALLRPVGVRKQRVHDIDDPKTGVDRCVQIATHRYPATLRLPECRLALCDGAVEHVQRQRPQELLLIGKVPIEGGDTDAGALCDRVAPWLPSGLEEEVDRGIDDAAPVPAGVRPT